MSRFVAAFAVACALAVVLAPSAFAHSVLLETEPGNDVVVQESPDRVSLRFNESVEMSLGGIRVFDGQGNRVDSDEVTPSNGAEVGVGIEGDLEPGTYTVAWRAISADSDPISGAFVFHVQERGVTSGVSLDSLTGTSKTVDVFFTAGRFFDFALLLLCLGGSVRPRDRAPVGALAGSPQPLRHPGRARRGTRPRRPSEHRASRVPPRAA